MVKGNAPQSGHSYQIIISQSLALPDRLRVEEGKIYARPLRCLWI